MAPPVDDQFFEPILGEQNANFRKLNTIPAFSVHLLISTLISLVGILLAAASPPEHRCHAYFIMMYLRAGFWVVTFVSVTTDKKESISNSTAFRISDVRSSCQVPARQPSSVGLPRAASHHEDDPGHSSDRREHLEHLPDGHPNANASILRR